jgi:hypothetical protein
MLAMAAGNLFPPLPSSVRTCLLLALLCLPLTACGTVTPDYTQAGHIAPGPDGLYDAGVKGKVLNVKTGQEELLIAEWDREELDILIARYGKTFTPPLTKDEGLIPFHGQYAARDDILVDDVQMKKYAAGFPLPVPATPTK